MVEDRIRKGAPVTEQPNTLRAVRERALNDMALVITASWGDRCARRESGCASCMAWAIFDQIDPQPSAITASTSARLIQYRSAHLTKEPV